MLARRNAWSREPRPRRHEGVPLLGHARDRSTTRSSSSISLVITATDPTCASSSRQRESAPTTFEPGAADEALDNIVVLPFQTVRAVPGSARDRRRAGRHPRTRCRRVLGPFEGAQLPLRGPPDARVDPGRQPRGADRERAEVRVGRPPGRPNGLDPVADATASTTTTCAKRYGRERPLLRRGDVRHRDDREPVRGRAARGSARPVSVRRRAAAGSGGRSSGGAGAAARARAPSVFAARPIRCERSRYCEPSWARYVSATSTSTSK